MHYDNNKTNIQRRRVVSYATRRLKSSAESVNLTKSDKEHDYAQNCSNPFDLVKKLKDQVQLLKNQNASQRSGNLPEVFKNRVVTEKSKGKLIPAHILKIMSKKIQNRFMKQEKECNNFGCKFCFLLRKQQHNFPLPGVSTLDKKFQFVIYLLARFVITLDGPT